MCSAAGQGALGIEIRLGDTKCASIWRFSMTSYRGWPRFASARC